MQMCNVSQHQARVANPMRRVTATLPSVISAAVVTDGGVGAPPPVDAGAGTTPPVGCGLDLRTRLLVLSMLVHRFSRISRRKL